MELTSRPRRAIRDDKWRNRRCSCSRAARDRISCENFSDGEMVLALRTSHPCDRSCRSDFRYSRTAAHDSRRRGDAVMFRDASAPVHSSRDDDKADKAVASDYDCCAETFRSRAPPEIASVLEVEVLHQYQGV